ncbi:translation initiation factor eIF-2B subunit gamma-like [Ctenocephalides felis]|uniref:translation initiation factor eIF-2B subunit gamma-like n=1 Tax=Ctenocephalides felis TaxID=7515 RepID=UPI000E6E30C7|nr:translation initiation factor eIF-2B subunit gamma-like [Ctenocephalides felis]
MHMEFQAVVFAAGKGSRFPEVIGPRAKCLIPIGQYPLIWYPLRLLERQGFKEAIVLVLDSHKLEIQSALDKTSLNLKLDFISIPSEDYGTAESLRFIRDKLTRDVLVVPCDIVTESNIDELLLLFRLHNATISCMFFSNMDEKLFIPGPKNYYKPEHDIVCIDKQTNRLVLLASASDYSESITFPLHLLKKHKSLTIFSKLLDSHIYAIRNDILDYLSYEKHITTIKGELIPLVVKKQLSCKISTTENENSKNSLMDLLRNDNTLNFNSAYNDSVNGSPKYFGDSIKCYAVVKKSNCLGIRVNNIASFCLCNQKIKELWPKINKDESELTLISQSSDIKSNQIDEKCIIGIKNVINEKTSLKNTLLESNCVVNPKVRITNSLIMSGVIIEENVIVEDCVIGCNAVIGKGSNLKACLIGHSHKVSEGSIKQKELLDESERLMEI